MYTYLCYLNKPKTEEIDVIS